MQALVFLFAILFTLQVNGHSMMTCAVLDGNTCVGAIRESVRSLQSTNYRFDNTNPCQPEARGVANLANKYSASSPMAVLSSGQTFTIQWTARNHAVANQDPRVVKMYLSPAIQPQQTADYSWQVFQQNQFCTGPYINCGNGANVDTAGDSTPCTLTCTLPSLADGTYTLLWHWNWTQNDQNNYMTCSDFRIGAAAPAPTSQAAATSTSRTTSATTQQTTRTTTTVQQSSQSTTRTSQSTTRTPTSQANSASETTAQTNGGCPDMIQRCKDICGENGIATCSCIGGNFNVVCKDTDNSSGLLIPALIVSIIAFLF